MVLLFSFSERHIENQETERLEIDKKTSSQTTTKTTRTNKNQQEKQLDFSLLLLLLSPFLIVEPPRPYYMARFSVSSKSGSTTTTTMTMSRKPQLQSQLSQASGGDEPSISSTGTTTSTTTTTTTATTTTTSGASLSKYVYIRSKEHGWIPARVVEMIPSSSKITTTTTATSSSSSSKKAKVLTPVHAVTKEEDANDIIDLVSKQEKTGGTLWETQIVDLQTYPHQSLVLQNVNDDGKLQPVADMVNLPFLHEVRFVFVLFCVLHIVVLFVVAVVLSV